VITRATPVMPALISSNGDAEVLTVKGSPFVFVQEFREFPMPDVFIRNLRKVSESALDSCCHAADDEEHHTEEREQPPSRGQQWTQAAGWDGKAR
jgi:hypothetical protein